ncbi:hypothetical protein L9F63_025933, partial [Diploptera punctata]
TAVSTTIKYEYIAVVIAIVLLQKPYSGFLRPEKSIKLWMCNTCNNSITKKFSFLSTGTGRHQDITSK